MVLGIQVIGLLFGMFMTYYTYLQFKRKDFTVKELGLWLVLWIVFIAVALFPSALVPVLAKLQIGRAMDLFVISGFMVLLFLFFYMYTKVRRMQSKLEQLVREIARKK